MPTPAVRSMRLLPDGTPLHNRLLAVLPAADYARIQKHLYMNTGVTGRTLQAHGRPVTDVYFPNGGAVHGFLRKPHFVAQVSPAPDSPPGRNGPAATAGRPFLCIPLRWRQRQSICLGRARRQ